MIFDTLANADRYTALHPLFARAFAYLRATDFAALSPGRYPVVGEQLFAIVEEAPGRSREAAKLECHRKYIDIQFVLEGLDTMGWRALDTCTDPVDDYSEAKDIRFFRDAAASWIPTPAGAYCIFFPQDAHAPLVSDGRIRKVILKIAVDA